MKFLIIRFSSIGDIVLTTPVIRCLKTQVANAEVHYLSKETYEQILKSNPYIDKIHFFKDDIREILPALKKEGFDVVIDLHHNLRSWRVKRYLKIKSYSFNKLNVSKFLLVNFKINRLPKKHIVERYLDTLLSFNVRNDNSGLDYFLDEADRLTADNFPAEFQAGFNALVLGGSYFTKRIPKFQLEKICEKSDLPIVLLGGKDEFETGKMLEQKFEGKVFNGCGNFSLNQSASVLQQSQRVFTSDTGMMHIAAAFKKDVFSFWGNTLPDFGMAPYMPGPNSRILEVKGLHCRPCSKLGFKSSPKKHFRCMRDIVLDEDVFLQSNKN